MSDRIHIQGLRARSRIGCHAWERDIRQVLVLDLELECDTRRAAASDALADALDYQAVADAVVNVVEAAEFELIEALAESVARRVLEHFAVSALRLRLDKPGAVAAADTVGVEIRRKAADYAP